MFVTVMHRIEQDEADVARLLLVIIALLDDPVEQFSTHHLLGDEVLVLWFVEDIVQPDDVFVVYFCQDSDFIL